MSEKKKPSGIKFNPWWITGAIILMFVVLNMMNGSNIQDPTKITTAKFDDLLNSGKIEKVVIYNNVQGEAYLTSAALKESQFKKLSKDVFGNLNKGPHFSFETGNNENFQKKLDLAIQQKKIKNYDYQPKNEWSELLISFLPFILIIGVWIFIMRRMSGGSSPGGQIFNIGKSRAKLFD